jgi:hypothetical protein
MGVARGEKAYLPVCSGGIQAFVVQNIRQPRLSRRQHLVAVMLVTSAGYLLLLQLAMAACALR